MKFKVKVLIIYSLVFLMLSIILPDLSFAADKEKLEIWLSTELAKEARQYQLDLIQEWGDQNNVQVEVSTFGWSDYSAKLTTAMASKNEPDIAAPGGFNVLQGIKLGRLYPLNDLFNRIERSGSVFFVSAREGAPVNGNYYNIPTGATDELFYLRKDWLEETGLPVPETWSDLKTVALKMSNPKENIYGAGFGLGGELWDSEKTFRIILWSFGGSLVEEDGKTIALNSEATKKTINYLIDLYKEGAIPPAAPGWSSSDNNKAWLEERVGAIINTGSVLWYMRENRPDLLENSIIMAPPKGPAGRFSYVGPWTGGWCLYKSSKNPELAKDLIYYLMKEENYNRYVELGGGALVPVTESAANLDMWDDPFNKAFIDAVKIARAPGYPGSATLPALEVLDTAVMTDMVGRVLINGWTPQKAIDEAVDRIKEIYEKHEK